MHDHTDIADRLRWANPIADPSDPPNGAVRADVALLEIERRSTRVHTQERTPTEQSPTSRPRPAVLAAAAAFVIVVLVVGLVALTGRNDADQPTATTVATTTTESPVTTTEAADAAAPGPTPVTTSFGSIASGSHRLDTFGSPITFTIESAAFFVQENRDGFFAISAPNSKNPDDRDLVVSRLSGLPDAAAPSVPGVDWSTTEFGSWLDTLAATVVVTDRVDSTVGGLPAIRVDLACAVGVTESCLVIDSGRRKTLDPNDRYRVWMVEQVGESPLALILGSSGNLSDEAWWDAFEQVVSSMTFGD